MTSNTRLQTFIAMLLGVATLGPLHSMTLLAQGQGLEGVWIGHQSRTIGGVYAPNHADGTFSTFLPGYTDPDPPKVFQFQFGTDGTYAFRSGVGTTLWASHRGRYQLRRSGGEYGYAYR